MKKENRVPFLSQSPIVTTAIICHEANKAWCEQHDDFSQLSWDEAEQWQKKSAIDGVKFRVENPKVGHDALHNNWMEEKIADGWVYGEVKDIEKKTHPCIVSYKDLPPFQQRKDALFAGIVDALMKGREI